MYHHMYGSWNSGWDWLWMTLMMLLWLAVIGGVAYGVVRRTFPRDRGEHRRDSSLRQ